MGTTMEVFKQIMNQDGAHNRCITPILILREQHDEEDNFQSIVGQPLGLELQLNRELYPTLGMPKQLVEVLEKRKMPLSVTVLLK